MAVPFLMSLARAYTSHNSMDLSEYMFIFPNRRACTFFLKDLTLCLDGATAILPKVTTMSEFIEQVSGRVIAGRIELLFILYEVYVSLLRKDGIKNVPEFDSFRRWGETALSDFNEVDMHDIDAQSLFKNVKDVKEISANFLTDDQLQVMEEYFGYEINPATAAENFWKSFTDREDNRLHSKFRLLWQMLYPLYEAFHETLDKRGLTSTGGAYRLTADRLEDGLPEEIDARHIVVVGFNALTSSERRIFDALAACKDDSDRSITEFFWDATGPVITDPTSTAGRYVLYNKRRWPSPEWASAYMAESDIECMPESIKVISVPSNTMQTKVISEVIEEMSRRLPESDFEKAKVAVVLPDEGLLIPMLYSLPDTVKDVNLTMGYPLKLTAVATFVSLLRRLQSSRRKTGNVTGYYFKDLELLLSHPFSHVIFGRGVAKVKDWIRIHHHAVIDVQELSGICSELPKLISPLDDNAGPREVAVWLDRILERVIESIGLDSTQIIKENVDISNIKVYRLALSRLLDIIAEYGIDMQWRTFLSLTDRMIAGETVTFEGQPLTGLQVMGLLETRALDFERVIIPSLNERIMPARRRSHTFISDSLRIAYGLPPVNYAESIFAYYFYRMIARAKEVVLLYDSRSSDGMRSGDVSRYILQLKYLYARNSLDMQSRSFVMSKSDLKPSPIMKTNEIREMLSLFQDAGKEGINLSATALTRYAACQLQFYFEHILRIRTDEEATDYMDSMTQGSVVHYVMEHLYLPEDKRARYLTHPVIIDAEYIKARISDTDYIDRLIRHAINKLHFHRQDSMIDTPLRGSSAFVAKVMRSQIIGILNFDLGQTPFELYGVEIDGNVQLKMEDGKNVNMRFAIDRLDHVKVIADGKVREMMRVVDYKTGTVHAETESLEAVFSGDYRGKNLLQLWLYANLFDALPDKNIDKDGPRPILDLFGREIPDTPLTLELYDVNAMNTGTHVYPKVDGEIQFDHAALNHDFLHLLKKTLDELFDPNEPFKPAKDEATCGTCQFKTICWK